MLPLTNRFWNSLPLVNFQMTNFCVHNVLMLIDLNFFCVVASKFFNQNKKQTIVFFHGNAGDLENRIYKLNHFKKLNVNFLIVSWRGFSGNNGKPTEQGLYKDAQKAVEWLEKKGINKKDIILYGESLGTGIAVELATKNEYSGIILESPYTSMIDMGKRFYPFLPIVRYTYYR